MHHTSLTAWIIFIVFILGMLLLDLGVFHKKSHAVGFKEAIWWSGFWILLSLAFSILILYWKGQEDFVFFITGYMVEKSLSVDNLFVFLLIFSYFKIPNQYQHKILFYGILGALVMRAFFIWTGVALIEKFHWIIYVFGGFLVLSGLKMFKSQDEEQKLENTIVMRAIKKVLPTTDEFIGDKFFTRINGKMIFTPLFITLIFVEISDLIFAVDSIPAIMGITQDPFLIFTSNVFAILGLRSLYFALKGFSDLFHMLKFGLAFILIFIGSKMLVSGKYHIPVEVTLIVIFGILIISMLASIIWKKNPIAPKD